MVLLLSGTLFGLSAVNNVSSREVSDTHLCGSIREIHKFLRYFTCLKCTVTGSDMPEVLPSSPDDLQLHQLRH